MGDQISVLGAHFKTAFPYSHDWPTYVEALNYPAGPDVIVSGQIGATKLASELNWVASHCSANIPNIVLAGHSQGAYVITQTLGGPIAISAKARSAIKAVALFGDPSYTPGMPYKVWNATGIGLLPSSAAQFNAIASTYKYFGYEPGNPATSPGWHYKVREWCFTGDAVCQSGLSSSAWTIHSAYTAIMDQVADWMDGRLTDTT